MANDKPFITYFDDDKLVSEQFSAQITRDLPQEGVEWQRSYGRISKTVYLEAKLLPFQFHYLEIDENDMKLPLLSKPLLHTFWTDCPDVDTYKSSVREAINCWMQKIKDKNIPDWFIIHVDQTEVKKGINKTKLLPRSSVLDKIKSDFSSGKNGVERCITLLDQQRNDSKASESYQLFLQRLRLLLLQSYSRQLLKYEEYIRTQRENRTSPNWNFFDFFFLQEELAFVFEMLGLYDEALVQYDELDALFSQFVINSNSMEIPSWLSKLSEHCDNWNGLCLSSVISKSLREQFKTGKATHFDLRNYLFSRQCELLMLLNKPWELASRSLPFLQNCVNEIQILEIDVIPGGIACWVFLSALEILQKCERYSDSSQMETYSLYTVGLWAYARNKLAELGSLCDLMPGMKFTSESLHKVVNLISGMGQDPHYEQKSPSPQVRLKEALSTQESFLKQYLEISELTMGTYKHIARMRHARLIGKDLALLYMKLNNPQKAIPFLLDLEKMYLTDDWPMLLLNVRELLLECYQMLEDRKKQLKVHCQLASCTLLSNEKRLNHFNYIEKFIHCITDETECLIVQLDEVFPNPNINLNLTGEHFAINNCDVDLELSIVNNLPNEISTEELAVSLKHESHLSETSKSKHIKGCIHSTDEKVKVNNGKNSKLQVETFHSQNLVGIKCHNTDHFLLKRKDSYEPFELCLYEKGPQEDNYEISFMEKSVVFKPGLNIVKLKFKPEQIGSYTLNQIRLKWNPLISFISLPIEKHICFNVINQAIEEPPIKSSIKILQISTHDGHIHEFFENEFKCNKVGNGFCSHFGPVKLVNKVES